MVQYFQSTCFVGTVPVSSIILCYNAEAVNANEGICVFRMHLQCQCSQCTLNKSMISNPKSSKKEVVQFSPSNYNKL